MAPLIENSASLAQAQMSPLLRIGKKGPVISKTPMDERNGKTQEGPSRESILQFFNMMQKYKGGALISSREDFEKCVRVLKGMGNNFDRSAKGKALSEEFSPKSMLKYHDNGEYSLRSLGKLSEPAKQFLLKNTV